MLHFQWGTAIFQLIIFLMFIGVPIVIMMMIRSRKSKIKELEQRIQKLENERHNEV